MHPATSLIIFTTAAGAGYGLLLVAVSAAIFGLLPDHRGFAFLTMAAGLGLAAGGLISSTFHLGHPERAWRALSQWRSSWLSREGVAALLTFALLGIFGIGWVFFADRGGLWAGAGLLGLVGAIVTIGCTAMIYASLKPIRAWNTPWTVANYYLLALASGALLLGMLLRLFGMSALWVDILALAGLVAAWAAKLIYWRDIDHAALPASPESATGLGDLGKVRQVLPPHTEENYLLKEMGFRLARKHATKLRRLALLAAFAAPIILLLLAMTVNGVVGAALSVGAVGAAAAGLLIERWLFFAEARHTVMLYYRA